MEWKKFKSGTDIRGIASEGVEGQHINLTDEAVGAMAASFAVWLGRKYNKSLGELRIGVGHDCRISSERIDDAVSAAISAAGATAVRAGMSSTPAMFMMTLDKELDGAIQITASHHPFNRNGLKFFTPEGGLNGKDISDILAECERGELPCGKDGNVEKCDYMPEYAARLRKLISEGTGIAENDLPLKGYKIVVDAGNGVGGFYANMVLEPLGADVEGSRFLEPDGMFPNHAPNPEDKKAMESICEAVLESKADLGVIFDTDVDRAGAVGPDGSEINRNRLIALSAAIAMEDCPGGTIVTDSTTSAALKTFIEKELGGKHYRYRRGYRNVIDKAIELNEQGTACPLAIETSGHAALKENYFLDDGAYLVTKIIITLAKLGKEGKTLSQLTQSMPDPVEECELRLPITVPDFAAEGMKILANLETFCEKDESLVLADDNREGVRATFEDGWFLLRLSVHDPIMPINLESESVGGVKKVAAKLLEALKGEEGVDLTRLIEFVEAQ
ncbi:MAG: phosphomannomutase/phosphoglucomutase [Ruminococcaceae bacterium]|nr:phosphomannomutase/phosphoglucomutase [Oscillospiraceae bacterium]